MVSTRPTILVIEDDDGYAELLARYLEDVPGFEFDFLHCPTAEQGLEVLGRRDVFVIFVDYRLGALDGVEVVTAIRAAGDMRPIIAMTADGFEHITRQFLQAGADDCLAKADLQAERLQSAIHLARACFEARCAASAGAEY